MDKVQAIKIALDEAANAGLELSSSQITERAIQILAEYAEMITESKGYDSLSAKVVKRSMNPLFKEQHAAISKLATSTASEYLSEGRDVWRYCKNNAERNVAMIVFNEIRERITRGFK